jgi:hypothetical protein
MGIRIDPYEQQVLPGGTINTDVPAGAFGMGIARGLADVGQGATQLGEQVQRVEEDQGRVWAATAVSQKELALQQTIQQRVNSLDPTDPDYAKKIATLSEDTQADITQAQTDLIDQAPGRYAKRFVGLHMAAAGLRLADGVMRTQAQLNGDYTKGLVQDGIKADSDILAASPDNDTYARLLQKQHDSIVGLTTINPTVKSALLESAAHTYANVQVSSVVAKDPQSFLTLVNAQGGVTNNRGRVTGQVPAAGGTNAQGGPATLAQPDMLAFANEQVKSGKSPEDAMRALTAKFPDRADKFAFTFKDGAFSDLGTATPTPQDPQVQPLNEQDIAKADVPIAGWGKLTWPEKVAYVRQAESQVGRKLAEDRGALSREVTDANAALLNGQQYPGLNTPRFSADNLKRVFGDDQGSRMAQQLAYSAGVGKFVAEVKVMPAAQREAMLQQYAPQPGPGYAEQSRTYDMAQRAAAQVQKQQQDKPIESAITAGIAGAKPLDFNHMDTLASQLRDRTVVAATMERDYGTKPQIFTEDEVKTLAEGLGKMTGKDRIATLANIRIGLNDPGAYSTAMNELAPKNPTLAYAGNLAARDGVAYVGGKAVTPADVAATIADGDILLNGRNLDKQMAKGDDPSMPGGAKAVNFNDTQFRTFFNQTLGGAFRSPDAQLSAAAQQETYNATRAYYAADAYKQGKPLDQIDPAGVQRAIEAVVGQPWKKNGGTLLAPYGMKPEDFQSQWNGRAKAAITAAGFDDVAADRLMDTAVPVNLADGLYGFQNGTRLLADPRTGRKVVVDFRSKN